MSAIGWVGVGLIVLAYLLNQIGTIAITDISYQVINIAGAVGILIPNAVQRDWPTSTLQIIWGAIALIQLIRLLV